MGYLSLFLRVFLRKKKNRTGSISVSIVEKRNGKLHFLHTVGYAADEASLQALEIQGHQQIIRLKAAQPIDFSYPEDVVHIDRLKQSIAGVKSEVCIRVLEQLFSSIGFDAVQDELFCHLVVMRLLYPVSKLKTIEYLYHYHQLSYEHRLRISLHG